MATNKDAEKRIIENELKRERLRLDHAEIDVKRKRKRVAELEQELKKFND